MAHTTLLGRIAANVTLLVALLFGRPVAAPAQTCPGDLNGDHEVTIDEVITAVNAALNGCPAGPSPTASATPSPIPIATPTPPPVTGCHQKFNQNTGDFCIFLGHINTTCGSQSLPVSFSPLGSFGVFFGLTPGGADCTQGQCYTFLAAATGENTARLTNWSNSLLDPYFQHTLSGTATLSADGQQLTLHPDASPFSISGCPFVKFEGTYRPLN